MQVDLSPFIAAALTVVVPSVPIVAAYGVKALAAFGAKHGIEVTAQQQALAEQLLTQAVTYGASQVQPMAAEKGWAHPDVHNAAVAKGLEWLLNQSVPLIEQAGLSRPDLVTHIQAELQRVAPAAIGAVAASAATTNGPTPPVVAPAVIVPAVT